MYAVEAWNTTRGYPRNKKTIATFENIEDARERLKTVRDSLQTAESAVNIVLKDDVLKCDRRFSRDSMHNEWHIISIEKGE